MRRRLFLRTGLAAAATATLAPRAVHALAPPRAGAAGPAATGASSSPAPLAAPAAGGPLRLNSNENALGPCEGARRAVVDALVEANRYTHGVAAELRHRVAAYHDVPESAVVFGNGSTEVLQMAVQALAAPAAAHAPGSAHAPGGAHASGSARAPGAASAPRGAHAPFGGRGRARIVVADPTFEHVEAYAEPWGLELVKVPPTPDHAHDLDRMRDAARAARREGRPAMAYICNPNNPTGSLTPSRDVEAWIQEADDVVFLVDEAYFEYVDHPSYRSALPLALARPNVVVVRTFSKIHGLAGLRLGYALAHPDTARRIAALSARSNLNVMGLRAAGASLDDPAHRDRSIQANAQAARITLDVLDELGIEWIPSHTNFVMHRVPGELEAYIRAMRERDVWVGRPFPPLLGYNRLSFGLPSEMERFADVLRSLRREGRV